MNADAQAKAQQRADRIAAFRAELAELEREGVLCLTAEQRGRLEAHLEAVVTGLTREYGVDITDSAKRISWGMRLASLLGGIAFFAALVLFLHRVWGALPTWGHVGVLVAVPVLLLVATGVAAHRGAHSYYVQLLALAAGAAFVMEMDTLGAIFNLAPSPHVLLAWAAFAILVAYAYGVRLLLGGGLLLLCVYGASWWTTSAGGYWADFFDHAEGFLPVAGVLYAVPRFSRSADRHDFHFVYRVCGAAAALTALLVMSKTGGHLCCSMVPLRLLELIYQLIGLGLSAAVVCHGLRLGRGGVVNLGAVAFIVFLLVRLHAWWWGWMPKYLFFLLIGITAIVLLMLFRRLRGRLTAKGVS